MSFLRFTFRIDMKLRMFSVFLPAGFLLFANSYDSSAALARGPLRVHPDNSRYFTDGTTTASGSLKAVYLTGSHTWANLQDQGATNPPPRFDYGRYLNFLDKYHHNFIRLWSWEQARWAPWSDGKGSNPSDWYVEPVAYARTGPGLALDGRPKFDLTQFDSNYFGRLRQRVKDAGDRGIYVSIMLFQGWSSAKGWLGGKPWPGHPYHPSNNTQQFNGNRHSDSGPDLSDPGVRQHQAAYIRKVIDTVNDLDNVLYEVTNEGGNKDWDWWVVQTAHEYQMTKPKQHPVGLTGHGSESNDEMLSSQADWFSPGSNQWPDLKTDPRAVDGKKVSLVDMDHVFGVGGDRAWVWKCFMRGHNVLLMDPYDDPQWDKVLADQGLSTAGIESARRAMGHTLTFAEKMELASMRPSEEMASTKYCLANPGREYLVYQPKPGAIFTLTLPPGEYASEWFDATSGRSAGTLTVQGSGEAMRFKPPCPGEAVLYLRALSSPARENERP